MATRDGRRDGPTTHSIATLGDEAAAASARTPAEEGEERCAREWHVAKRCTLTEAREHEMLAEKDAWWCSMTETLDREERGGAQMQEGAMTHAAVAEGQDRGAQRYQPADEHVYALTGDRDVRPGDPVDRKDQEERKKRQDLSSQSDGQEPSLLEWAETQLMKTS